ncbi:MAG: Ferredoxin--NADP reductase [Xylophilus sp.]|nr:NAD(P)/FAD-dependent oxidoreductase [Xylophilus sp.]KAF1046959.1 MAG: Ferredoxin--NADP reductase [Xylophilus sp.]
MTGTAQPIETDAAIIGAGPVGLFQVFQLGLHEVHAHVVDALPHVGGQCAELYPDKPIYDIPGIAACTGRELARRLQAQAAPFAPTCHLGQEVAGFTPQPDGRFLLETTRGTRLLARNVVVAAGVGAFVPRQLKVEGLDAFTGTQLLYRSDDPAALAGRQVVIYGGDDIALGHAIALAEATADRRPAAVTVVFRRDVFQAEPAAAAVFQALRDAGRVAVVAGQITAPESRDGRLAALRIAGPDGGERRLPADVLVVALGLSPRLGPIAGWGLALERKQLPVDTATFATAMPGVFAVGDINTYPGKRKLILCGFHEATLAAFAIADRLFPERRAPLQYTTTSTRLHALLGQGGQKVER